MSTGDTTQSSGLVARLGETRARVRRTRAGRLAWRVGVGLVGGLLIVVGIALLALPGPGWLIIFAGLGVLATEFEWAARLLRFARERVAEWSQWIASQSRGVQALVGLAGVIVLAALVFGAWYVFVR